MQSLSEVSLRSLHLQTPNVLQRLGVVFRTVWLMIFLGGVGLLVSLLAMGTPMLPFVGFTVLEIVGAPLFVWWQSKLHAK